ncbi:hypothetical protein J2Z44_002626, partial [Clostridium punense]|nr:hypothetical protein [Clostridium punense]
GLYKNHRQIELKNIQKINCLIGKLSYSEYELKLE